MRPLVGLALAAAVGAACLPPDVPPDTPENELPIARLVGPQLAQVGVAASYDASASDDVDGAVVAVSFTFSDGSGVVVGDADGRFDHVFAEPGRFTVRAEVFDNDDGTTPVQVETVVVAGEIEPCACDAPCLDAGVCTGSGCVVLASSTDEEPTAPDDVIDCE